MATRVYSLSAGTPGVTPADWEFPNQINPVSVPGTLTRNTGSPMVSKLETTGTAQSPTFRAMGRTILGPIAATTISGTVKGQMRGFESNAAANATLALAIKLVQPNGADRGVLLAPVAADLIDNVANELGTTIRNAQFKSASEVTPIDLTSQTAQNGDYLVIEWGFRSQQGLSTARNITLSYGNNSATDLGENATETAANNPWWEFSSDFALYVDPNALPTTTLTLHVNASDADRLFTTFNAGGAHTGTPVDGSEVVVWDDEGDGIPDICLGAGGAGTRPVWRSTTPGMLLPCLAFGGDDNASSVNQIFTLAVPMSSLITTTAFTVFVAFYPESITATGTTIYQNHPLLAEGGGPYFGIYLKDDAGIPKIYGYNFSGGVTVVPETGFPVLLNTSYVFMFRHEAGSIYASLNGGAESATVSGTTFDLSTRLWVGGGAPSATPYTGRIGEIAIYNTALTGATLTQALNYFLSRWAPAGPAPRNLTAALSGTSLTPAAAGVVTVRLLTSTVVGASTTPASLLTTVRRLMSTVAGVSATPASLLTTARRLTSTVVGASTTPAALVEMPALRLLTASMQATTQTPAAEIHGIFVRLTTPVGANHGYTFPATSSVLVVPGTQHGLGTERLHVAVYDTQTPRHLLTAGAVQVDPTTFDVAVSFAQPQGGLLVLNAGRPADGPTGNYRATFGPMTTLTIPETVHHLGTATILGVLYDASTPGAQVTAGQMTVDEASFEVVFTFAQPQSGVVVLCGYMGTGGTPNSMVTLPGTSPVSIPQAMHGLDTAALLVSVYDTSSPRRRVTPGQVTVDATTHAVELTFAQGQLGTAVLNGSTRVAVVALRASLQGVSSTSPALAELPGVHAFTAVLSATSTTPSSAVTLVRQVAASLSGVSTTPSSAVQQVRALTTTVVGHSTTPASAIVLLRNVTATLAGASTTPASALTMGRVLQTQIAGSSTTPPVTASVTAVVSLAASLSGSSTTPTSTVVHQRALQSQLAGASLTPDATISMAALRVLTASVQGSSVTPASALTVVRRLSATVAGASVTPASLGTVQRLLVASLSASSTTPPVGIVLGGLRALAAGLSASSTTPAALVTHQRRLSSVVLGASSTPLALATMQRRLSAVVSATSQTPVALLIKSVVLRGVLQGTSQTPAALVTLLRTFQTQVQGVSLTPSSVITQQRLLQSSVLGTSVTPASLGLLQRRLAAALAGSSTTADSLIEVMRHLRALLAGEAVTPEGAVTMVRPLAAGLEGSSLSPPAQLIPFSGEMVCRASLVGVSHTPDAALALLPAQRISVVQADGRVAVVTSLPRLTVVG